jgi:CHAT domain-containing protein
MVRLLIAKDTISASEHSLRGLANALMDAHRQDIERALTATGKIARKEFIKTDQDELTLAYEKEAEDFDKIVEYYRHVMTSSGLLRGPKVVPDTRKITQEESRLAIGKALYQFLLEDIQEQTGGITTLLIIPDGILNFLPFETLIDGQGHYAVERYHIRYAPSLTVLETIKERHYPTARKALMAFGGAVYNPQTYQAEMIENQVQLAYLRNQVARAARDDLPLQEWYASMGYDVWSNLPGTLQEVNAIGQVVRDADVLTGEAVTESRLKTLSVEGALAEYRVLHFATHGVAIPELPELSALVLSEEDTKEDGYLRLREIADLNIQADFVNLSACETGLGKIYSGEGVVGLTQTFLVAGANGLSVSLWQVPDASTAKFMVELYTAISEQELSYAQAVTAVKRRFIEGEFGEKWRSPYYWAPFVYYGQ